ncbi:MAG: PEP-CTERM sorting domain-containing protein [Phycisphaerae bacterium]
MTLPEPSSLGLAVGGAVGAMLLLKRRVRTVSR